MEPQPADGRLEGDVEEVDALPVLADPTTIEQRRSAGQIVVRQAAAVAATSFAAGIATVVVARAQKGRRARRRARRNLPVVASRSFLVDVHLLGPRD
jgi:hypothetical protein